MNFGDAFAFVFNDKDWFKKILIMGLVGLIPIIGQIVVLGWSVQITRNIIRHEPVTLPELDFSNNLTLGFKAWVISLVYSLPMIIFYLPLVIIGVASNNMNSDTSVILLIASLLFGGLMFLYGVVMMFLLPAAYGRLADQDTIGAGLEFGEVFQLIRKTPVSYLIVVLGSLVAGIIAPIGTVAFGIGVILTSTYALAIMGHFYGQAYNEAKALN